jgi:hypothetical protein
MRSLRTTIEIDAPPERVWAELTRFESWPAWNPLITRIEARLEPGADVSFDIVLDGRRLHIEAAMHRVVERRDMRWRGPRSRWQARLFRGEHYFSLEPVGEARTRFVHGEDFDGWALPLMWWRLEQSVRSGYQRMNEALKRRVEAGG